jgi:hypothetical protein
VYHKSIIADLTGEAVMLKSRNKYHYQTILTHALNAVLAEMPMVTIAFGVLANFAWVAVLFWFLSYWIVWH